MPRLIEIRYDRRRRMIQWRWIGFRRKKTPPPIHPAHDYEAFALIAMPLHKSGFTAEDFRRIRLEEAYILLDRSVIENERDCRE